MTREGKKREGKEHKEIIKSYKEKKFGMSLQGLDIWKVGHRPGESLTLLNVLGINTKIRIKNSLADTELDNLRIRIGGRDKIPGLKDWVKGALGGHNTKNGFPVNNILFYKNRESFWERISIC